METIKRRIETKKKTQEQLERLGYSSGNVLTFVFKKDKNGNETILNFDEKETAKIKNFMKKFD